MWQCFPVELWSILNSLPKHVRPHFDFRANFSGYILTTGLGRAVVMDSSSEGKQCQDAAQLWLRLECSLHTSCGYLVYPHEV